MSLNGAILEERLMNGEAMEVALVVQTGVAAIVAWTCAEYISLSVVDGNARIVGSQLGQVALCVVQCSSATVLRIILAMGQRFVSQHDAHAIDMACRFLSDTMIETPLSPDMAWCMLRCAWLSSAVQSFIEDGSEYCVFKRRLATSSKKLLLPEVVEPTTTIQLLEDIHSGQKEWKQSSGSFSTLMRFLQKTKDEFRWTSDVYEAPVEIVT